VFVIPLGEQLVVENTL